MSALPGQAARTRTMRARWQGGHVATERYRARLAARVRPGMRLLHAGCGWDKLAISRPYRESCAVVGLDPDAAAGGRFHSAFLQGTLEAMPFAAASFDLAFLEYVLEHIADPAAAFREMRRVLRPGGRVLILTPNLYSYKTLAARLTPYRFHRVMGRLRGGASHAAEMYPTRYRANTAARIGRLARAAGLRPVAVEYITNGPTWFEQVPGLFALADLYHRALAAWPPARRLRCALIVELQKE